ncbi:MAG: hypothetical protein WD467_00485 [Candidatus Saccharimonadales bacterium]
MKTVAGSQYHDRTQRVLEIATGAMSWSFFIIVIVVSYFSIVTAAYILIGYTLWWLTKIFGYSNRLIRAYWRMRLSRRVDWQLRLMDLNDTELALERLQLRLSKAKNWRERQVIKYYSKYLVSAHKARDTIMPPEDIYHAVIIAIYNEDAEILASTVQAVIDSNYDAHKMILIIAHEARGGAETAAAARALAAQHAPIFKTAVAIEHPADMPGEAKAKAGNITYAARWLTGYIEEQAINPEQVMVTTLDVDNRPSPNYFAEAAYCYAITPNRTHNSYQPIPMFFNNIWDAPALMRVIAVSNSFWVLMEALRPHRLRNFSAHAQSLQTLIDVDYWNVASIVEDGHQYWRTYFAYKGEHKVLPIFSPIYQDAVLVEGYWRTFKAQFYQLRRWAWGVADTPFVLRRSFHEPEIPLSSRIVHNFRQIEGYLSWVVAPIILAGGGWLPLLINVEASDSILAVQLPTIVSLIQTGALIGLLAPIASSLMSLPPRPDRYGPLRSVMMVLQWAFVPVTLIVFGSMAALNAQTRLLFGKYLEAFNVTEKKRIARPDDTRN